jgi:8-oxo-dGTP pyrophosphatase MutT (NUDIX family)
VSEPASPAPYRVTATVEHFRGSVFSLVTDTVQMPDGATAVRDYVRHMGAVAVVAVDGEGQVVLIRQYRHPVGEILWELPAGLMDIAGEDPAVAAGRELSEEAGLVAASVVPLITMRTSPGYTDEKIQIFLAQGLSDVDDGFDFVREFEESTLTIHRMPLTEALSMVDRGEVVNGVCALGLLAAARRLDVR